jgi:hypothetical protein
MNTIAQAISHFGHRKEPELEKIQGFASGAPFAIFSQDKCEVDRLP